MGQWVCGVTIVKQENMELHSSHKFVQLLELTNLNDDFIVVGENSENNVFHTHFLIKTNSRADSVRRTLLNAQCKLNIQLDICKLAGCRYWRGMFCYLLKNPLMVYSSNQNLADLAWTMIEDGSCIRYLNKENPSRDNQCREVVKVINDIIDTHNCKTTEDIFIKGNDLLLKFLHMSNLEQVMKNCLQYKLAQKQCWDPKSFKFAPEADPRAIHNILNAQNISTEDFDQTFWKWINRENGKKNTIILIGPSNTGKTVFIRGLIQLVPSGSLINTSSPFFAEGIAGCKLGYWEEPLLTSENAEIFKQIAEGTSIMLPQKFKKPFQHPGCPIIITTNHSLTRFCASEETAFKNRTITYHWYNIVHSSSRLCSDSCLYGNRDLRGSTPCNLSWSPSSGNSDREPITCDWGSNSGGSQLISQCGRWWCGSHNNKPCRYCSGIQIQCTNTGRPSCSSSTSTSNYNRSSGGKRSSRSPEHGGSSGSPKPILRSFEQSSAPVKRISKRVRTSSPRRGDGELGSRGDRENDGSDRESDPECSTISGGGLGSGTVKAEKTNQTDSGRVCTCIVEPLKADWQAYLCYLARKYD